MAQSFNFGLQIGLIQDSWMLKKHLITTGAPWESVVGYSRAVRVGPVIEVSGTIALDPEGNSTGIGDPYQQTTDIIEIARGVLEKAGSSLDDVIRTRIYVTDISRWRLDVRMGIFLDPSGRLPRWLKFQHL